MRSYTPEKVTAMIDDIKLLRKDLPTQKAIAEALSVTPEVIIQWKRLGTGRLQMLALGALLAGLHTH